MSGSGPSALSTSVNRNNYYVFLSFHGKDTRKGFTDHLYHKLREVGQPLHPDIVFRDDEKLPPGERFEINLIEAINRCKFSIPIISENYAASKWCLIELHKIMECVENKKQKVFPVLYKVKPDDVRSMLGKFGDAAWHGFDEEIKRKGKEALEKVLATTIYVSEEFANGYEGELVIELVEKIRLELQRDFLPTLPVDVTGFDDRVAEVMNLADAAFPETRVIVIYGLCGIGKTTLATIIYEKLFNKFKCHSFLKDIRETINCKGMKYVQSLFISDITKTPESKVRYSEIGIKSIQFSCEEKKALILLDDVDSQDHLDKLIGDCSFESGSRIIVTCRDRALLKSEYKEYELKGMNRIDSLLLFEKHAFKERVYPSKELLTLSSDIVDTTGGLPLALVMVGSFLKGKSESIWRETLAKLRNVPNEDVEKMLRITYDSLRYEEQQMFLDIACFFIGIDKTIVTYLWEDLRLYPNSGLARMIDLSLIKYDDENKLRMHDQLRDLGRAIACPADKKPWDCSRLWDEEAITVQRSKEENRNIEALSLDKNGSRMFMARKSYTRMPYLKFLRLSEEPFDEDFEDSLSELRWLEWDACPDTFKATNVHLEKLLVLKLSGGSISKNWKGWSSIKMERLKVLNLWNCKELLSIPNLSGFKKLEKLILEYCIYLKEIDPSIGDVKCLISLNLRSCASLKKLPEELGELKELEELIVDRTGIQEFPECIESLNKLKMLSAVGCGLLSRVPPQLGEVKGLVSLNLMACRNLQGLPQEIGKLEELKELNIGSSAIREIGQWIGSLKKLEMLDASDCMLLDRLDDSITHLVNLSNLDLRGCIRLSELPKNIGSLVKLQHLSLGGRNCSYNLNDGGIEGHLSHIPKSIGNLKWLTKLILSFTRITKLPGSIEHLENLEILDVSKNKKLLSLPSAISKLRKLEELDASYCKKLEGEIPIDGLSSLKILRLCSTQVSCFPNAFDKLSCLQELDLWGCKKLTSLPESISQLPSLKHLDLTACENLQLLPELPSCLTVLAVTCKQLKLPQLSHLIHLKELTVESCTFLKTMPELPPGIEELHVSMCFKLKELPSLSSLRLLSGLSLRGCRKLTEIKDLKELKSLKSLDVSGCSKLSKFDGLESLESLRRLHVSSTLEVVGPPVDAELCGRKSLSKLDLWQLTNLEQLRVEGCVNVVENLGLEGLKHLEVLDIHGCKSIATLPDLSQLTNLQQLRAGRCVNLVEIKGLEGMKNLGVLDIHGCKSIATLPDLSQLTNLQQLRAKGCVKLVEIKGLEGLKNLERLDIHKCKSIATLPDLSQLINLQQLKAGECINLVEILGFEGLKNLVELDIQGTNLKQLRAGGCVNLGIIEGLESLKNLEELDIHGCISIATLGLKGLKNLRILDIQGTNLELLRAGGCVNLGIIKGLETLETLEGLDIQGCKSIATLPDLSQLTNLQQLRARGCVNLVEIKGLEGLKNLEGLDIHGCTSIATLLDISQLTNLKKLNAEGCVNLVEIEGLETLENLKELDICGCTSIVNLPPQSWFDKLKYYRKQDGFWYSGPGESRTRR